MVKKDMTEKIRKSTIEAFYRDTASYKKAIKQVENKDKKLEIAVQYTDHLLEKGENQEVIKIANEFKLRPSNQKLNENLMRMAYTRGKAYQKLAELSEGEESQENHQNALKDFYYLSNRKEKIDDETLAGLGLKIGIIKHFAFELMDFFQYERSKEQFNDLIKAYEQLQLMLIDNPVNGVENEVAFAYYQKAKINYCLGVQQEDEKERKKLFLEAISNLDMALEPVDNDIIDLTEYCNLENNIIEIDLSKEDPKEISPKEKEKIRLKTLPKGPLQDIYLIAQSKTFEALKDYENADMTAKLAYLFLTKMYDGKDKEKRLADLKLFNEERIQVRKLGIKVEPEIEIPKFELPRDPEDLAGLLEDLVQVKDGREILSHLSGLEKNGKNGFEEEKMSYYKGIAQTITGIGEGNEEYIDLAIENFEQIDFEVFPTAQAYQGLAYLAKKGNKTKAKKAFKESRKRSMGKKKKDDRTKEDFSAIILATYCLECFKDKDTPKNETGAQRLRKTAVEKKLLTDHEINSILSLVPLKYRKKRKDHKKETF